MGFGSNLDMIGPLICRKAKAEITSLQKETILGYLEPPPDTQDEFILIVMLSLLDKSFVLNSLPNCSCNVSIVYVSILNKYVLMILICENTFHCKYFTFAIESRSKQITQKLFSRNSHLAYTDYTYVSLFICISITNTFFARI